MVHGSKAPHNCVLFDIFFKCILRSGHYVGGGGHNAFQNEIYVVCVAASRYIHPVLRCALRTDSFLFFWNIFHFRGKNPRFEMIIIYFNLKMQPGAGRTMENAYIRTPCIGGEYVYGATFVDVQYMKMKSSSSARRNGVWVQVESFIGVWGDPKSPYNGHQHNDSSPYAFCGSTA